MSKWLEKEIAKVLDRLGRMACKKFGYQYSKIKRMHANDSGLDKMYGYYVINDKEIRIAIKKTATKFCSIESLLDTLMHEIAHAGGAEDEDDLGSHDSGWRARYKELKLWARKYIYD